MTPPDIEGILKRYLEIQETQKRLDEEKQQLRDALIEHLRPERDEDFLRDVEGQQVKIRYRKRVDIEYDERILAERLGNRYPAILAPDIKKIRRRLNEIEPYLAPVVHLVGSPSPDRVKIAVQEGVIQVEEFRGAFQKTEKPLLAVSRIRPQRELGPNAARSSPWI